MQATAQQLARAQRDMSAIAKEQVTVEQIGGSLYAFGSEIATLRIFAKYNANGAHPNAKARVGYSENMKSFYFNLDM